jgi:hypothetical protein
MFIGGPKTADASISAEPNGLVVYASPRFFHPRHEYFLAQKGFALPLQCTSSLICAAIEP